MPVNAETIKAAKDNGYSDGQIRDYIVKSSEYAAAKKAGYGDDEIFKHLGLESTLPSFKTQKLATKQDVMGVATPRQREEAATIRQNLPSASKIGRVGMQGIGATAGGIIGAPIPGGAIAGGALGYAIGNKLADIAYNDRQSTNPRILPRSQSAGARGAIENALLQSVEDMGTGLMYEGIGLGMNALGKGVGNVVDIGKAIKSAGGVATAAQNYLTRSAERHAAQKIAAAKTANNLAAAQIEKNRLANNEVEKGLPGFQFNLAQKGGDPNLLSMARQTGQMPGVGTALSNESVMAQNQALRDNIETQIKGKGSVNDWLLSLQAEKRELEKRIVSSAMEAESVANKHLGMDDQGAGGLLREKAVQSRSASSQKAKELFENVDPELKIESGPVYQKIRELFGSFNAATQRLGATPTDAMKRMQNILEPEEAKQLFDYESVYKSLASNTGVQRGKGSKGFFTGSDFKYALKRDFPSVAGYTKNDVFAALKAGINGESLTPFNKKILDDMAYDLESKGFIKQKDFMPSEPNAVTFKDLQDFRSQVKTGARKAYASGDYELGWKYDQLANAATETFEQAAEHGGGNYEALRDATNYWRNTHVPTYRHGATGKILVNKSNGESQVFDSAVAAEYFKPGKGAVESSDSFKKTFGNDPGAKTAIKDYAAQSLLKSARNPQTGELDSKRVASWLSQHKTPLEKFGLSKEFDGVANAVKIAEEAKRAEASFNKSALGKALDADPDKAIAQAIMVGSGKKQSISRLQELVRIAKKDSTGAAMDGLRAAIGDYFERETSVTARDLAQNKMESLAKVDRFIKEFRPALAQSGLYTPKQMAAFDNVHKALVGIAKQQTPHPGFSNSPTFELVSRLAASGTSMAFGHIGLYGAAKGVYTLMERPIKDKIEVATARALFDPRYAEAIERLARNVESKMPISQAEKVFSQRLAVLGGIAVNADVRRDSDSSPSPKWQSIGNPEEE